MSEDAELRSLLTCRRATVRFPSRPDQYGGAAEGFEVFSRYEIEEGKEGLGWGSYGCVCEALDTETGRKVAIKKLQQVFSSEQRTKATLREIRLLRHFSQKTQKVYPEDDGSHDNILRLFDVMIPLGNANESNEPFQTRRNTFDTVYLVLELYDHTLEKVIADRWQLSEQHRAYLTYQLLRGVKTIHSAGCIHRDLKPANILVRTEEGAHLLAICDLGSGRAIDRSADTFATNARQVCSTAYISPEAIFENTLTNPFHTDKPTAISKEQFHALDVWSIACILVKLITGQEIFLDDRSPIHQLVKMAVILGPPPESMLDTLEGSLKAHLIKSIKEHAEADLGEHLLELRKRHPVGDEPSPEEIDLLKKMLRWTPEERTTVQQALEHPYFGRYDIHNEDDEPNAEPFVDEIEGTPRDLIWGEMLAFRPELARFF